MSSKRFLPACAALIAVVVVGAPAQGLPPPQDLPYVGPITLRVDATDLDHRVLQVRESMPVRPGRLTLPYPEWIPGNHGLRAFATRGSSESTSRTIASRRFFARAEC
jgi:hypothetical protein